MVEQQTSSRATWLNALCFLLGVVAVIGHNVIHILPNEVFLLVPLFFLASRFIDGQWIPKEFSLPKSWVRTIAIAVGVAAVRLAVGDFIIVPFASKIWAPPVEHELKGSIQGNLGFALAAVAAVWVMAAFGEELSYRGLILNRFAKIFKESKWVDWLAVVVSAALFGLGHYYKGWSGVIDSGFAGLLLGAAFVLTGKNLWTSILAHGLIDTTAIVLVYFGLAN